MDLELKQRWVGALRSGDYAQGAKRLRNADNTYCCLGVLCDLINPKGWNPSGDADDSYRWGVGRSTALLPPSILIEIGLHEDLALKFARKNDNGKTFAEIADMIEEEA
jgi:hypothetical protein